MAVEIEIELDAAGVEGEIGAIASSLAGLERVADGLDIDFDGDIQELAGNLDELAESLEDIDIDFGLDGLQKQLDEVKKEMNDFELDHEVNFNAPEGGGGGGDSGDSGGKNRDSIRTDIDELANMINNSIVDALGGAFGSLDEGDKPPTGGYAGGNGPSGIPYRQIYGNDAVMMAKRSDREGKNDFSAGALHKLSGNDNLHNLGASDPRFASGESGRVGTRSGYGLDSVSMGYRRDYSPLSRSSIMAGADPDDRPFLRQDHPGVPALAERKERDVGGYTLVDLIEELKENAREAMEDYDSSFEFTDFNEDARDDASIRDMELYHQARRRGGFTEGKFEYEPPDPMEGLSDIEKQQKKLYEAAGLDPEAAANGEYELAEGGPNSDKRAEELTDKERMQLERQTGFQGSKPGSRVKGRSNIVDRMKPKKVARGFNVMGRKLKDVIPSMGQYMQLLAAAIPVLATFAVEALGVAAALGAVGVAGAGIMGLGMMGDADNLAEGMGNAKSELKDFKEEMFDTLQPAMQTFSPIQARMMDAIPGGMGGIVEEMQGLAQFEDTLMALGGMAAGGIERFFAIINNNADAISQLSKRFGGLIGTALLDFFEFLIQEAAASQDLLVNLGSTLVEIGKILFGVAKFVSKLVATLKPLFQFFSFLAGLLENSLLSSILVITIAWAAFTVVAYKALLAVNALAISMGKLGGSGFVGTMIAGVRKLTGMLYGLISAAWSANAAFGVLASLATLGLAVGAAAVTHEAIKSMAPDTPNAGGGGGPGRMGTGTAAGGGGGPTYQDYSTTVINQPDNDYASQKMVTDKIGENEAATGATTLPETDGNAESSDTEANQNRI
jgi:hypothetical protein